ncbi:MAG: glycosyltransferase family 2 protein [Alloprevotella sp.]|nr:glycosyltransferase family 2 protein [Alloprevotella sp.]
MVVEILISTINAGILRIDKMLLPACEKVRYFISWQHTDNRFYAIPKELSTRRDVTLLASAETGLSKNRNNALQHAHGELLIIADDDCTYTPEYIDNVLKAFAENPEAQIICFQALTPQGHKLKKYPQAPFFFQDRPKGYYPSSVEIALRNLPSIPLFDERFGLGAPYLACGEEEVFLYDALRLRMTIQYLPIPIVNTTAETSGQRFLIDESIRRSKGATLCYLYGPIGAVARCGKEILFLRGITFKQKVRLLKDTWHGIKYIAYGNKG